MKPNNLGSSIGINKASNREEFNKAICEAFEFDNKVIVEEFLQDCKEYNISVVEKNIGCYNLIILFHNRYIVFFAIL